MLTSQRRRPFARGANTRGEYTRLMAMEYAVQRLEMGDVALIDLPGQGGEVEARVMRVIERTETAVRVLLRVEGREDFVKSGRSTRWSPSCAAPERPAAILG